jgi:tRNA threonylcarbamoyladenosine biosynthesis protein TsaB
MRILALETIAAAGSVALLDDQRIVAELELDTTRRSAQTLTPGIDQLLKRVGWRPGDVELVAVASGPGSFTGLRIGVTTAKTFAYAVGCPVIGVHSLLAIASRAPRELANVSAAVDAQRGELFVADFHRLSDGSLEGVETTRIVSAAAWLASLPEGVALTGAGLEKHLDALTPGVNVVERELWAPTAAIVGQLGHRFTLAGQGISPFELVPQYCRRTAAEEKWDAKGV